ncbi:DNA topoisomerase 3 [Aspergillus clavatus NRRL 1]|uniref:DNA topoisomerase n=1 Tax=Aspergillus clavatus (strain ATCC 1007 / CBS 513.65 / DSM 816 / NCTC 3887 / NRRL 1 / QM 1276 / 107) TaxID=344612 RepID=A1CF66_ASPCL|nr:DNA topoisomerase III, putative [Aspergillus clavatus NRRL 1]EAW11515.1 DNA topoisomerase III, putative [Aspergillus clavatus NRRL 1]
MTVPRILCVAEKPAIAKAVAQHLSGGSMRTISIRGNQYVKNYLFEFNFGDPWGTCSVTMTSVLGHLMALDFESQYKGWQSCPPGSLFEAPVHEYVETDKQPIAENIRDQARASKALFIWTDCDREGEHIGTEVRLQAKKGNGRILVKRARFSNTERAHVLRAARALIDVDENQANAVAARIELDLRIGAAFTRLQCLQLKPLSAALTDKIISYGSCQFPTLGFVVDRYLRVKNFKPETFWGIKVMHVQEGMKVNFLWRRVHLFDRAVVTVMMERCLLAKKAKVTKVNQKPTSKWRPLPLTTVDLQMMGSRYLRMDSQKVMRIAEALYTKGFISYPRTETDQFDKGIDLKKLIEKQFPDGNWGDYARGLINGAFKTPRSGKNNDQAHPPIHPVCWVSPSALSADEKKVYEFVVRRFLACCSDDAKGQATEVEIQYGEEMFHANGLIVLEKNYLEVYVYDKWESSQELPNFRDGELFEPTEAKIFEGKTTPPNYLTEPELIGLMDANGIGTDATMAEHIAKIKDREYVAVHSRGSGRNAVKEFIPTRLGIALVEGYDNVVAHLPDKPSLSKPFLRKEMELRMREICAGSKTRQEVVQESLDMYREVFIQTQRRIHMLKDACRKYLVETASV